MAEDSTLAEPAAPADPFATAVTPLRPGSGAALSPVPAGEPAAAFTHPFGQADGASRALVTVRAGRWRVAARQALMPDTPVTGLLATPARALVLATTWQLFDAGRLTPLATHARGAGAVVLAAEGNHAFAIDRSGGFSCYDLADGSVRYFVLTGGSQTYSYDWIGNRADRVVFFGEQRTFDPHGPATTPSVALEAIAAPEPYETGHNQVLLNVADSAFFTAPAAAPACVAARGERVYLARRDTLLLTDWALRPVAAFAHQFQPHSLSVDAAGTSHLLLQTTRGPRYWRINESGQRTLEVVLDDPAPFFGTPPILGFDGRVFLRLSGHLLVVEASGRASASIKLHHPRARAVAQPDGTLLIADGTTLCRVGADLKCETLVELPGEALTPPVAVAPDAILVATATQLLRLEPAP